MIEDTSERIIEWGEDVDESKKHRQLRIFFLVATLCVLVWFFFTAIPIFLLLTPIFFIIFLVFYLFKTLTYDFSLYGDVIRASVLHNQKRRRRKIKFHVSDVVYISHRVEADRNTKYYCDKNDQEGLCTMVVRYRGGTLHLIFRAYEDFLDALKEKVQ